MFLWFLETMDAKDTLLTYPEAALLLRISPLTLRKKVMRREVPVLKPFGRKGKCLFSEQDLRAMLERSRVPATLPAAPGRRVKAAAGAA